MQPQIVLASTSPRRRELLDQIGVRYSCVAVAVDETGHAGEAPETLVLRLALAKARAGQHMLGERELNCPVLGADTVVVADGAILGKPRDRDDALAMLERLSGRTHTVLTAVALAGETVASRLSVSHVAFRVLTRAQCVAYWNSGEPCDKAGAYAIQGRAGMFVRHLEGSYSGVMGLPLYETAELL